MFDRPEYLGIFGIMRNGASDIPGEYSECPAVRFVCGTDVHTCFPEKHHEDHSSERAGDIGNCVCVCRGDTGRDRQLLRQDTCLGHPPSHHHRISGGVGRFRAYRSAEQSFQAYSDDTAFCGADLILLFNDGRGCVEFFEFSGDRLFSKDMQKDRIITTVATVELNPTGANKEVVVRGIDRTVMYDKDGNELAVIEGGYLDIGLIDTMKDLAVNMAGALVFSAAGFLYIHRRDKYKFAGKFIITIGETPQTDDSIALEQENSGQKV